LTDGFDRRLGPNARFAVMIRLGSSVSSPGAGVVRRDTKRLIDRLSNGPVTLPSPSYIRRIIPIRVPLVNEVQYETTG
jgi:hypothetical protein